MISPSEAGQAVVVAFCLLVIVGIACLAVVIIKTTFRQFSKSDSNVTPIRKRNK